MEGYLISHPETNYTKPPDFVNVDPYKSKIKLGTLLGFEITATTIAKVRALASVSKNQTNYSMNAAIRLLNVMDKLWFYDEIDRCMLIKRYPDHDMFGTTFKSLFIDYLEGPYKNVMTILAKTRLAADNITTDNIPTNNRPTDNITTNMVLFMPFEPETKISFLDFRSWLMHRIADFNNQLDPHQRVIPHELEHFSNINVPLACCEPEPNEYLDFVLTDMVLDPSCSERCKDVFSCAFIRILLYDWILTHCEDNKCAAIIQQLNDNKQHRDNLNEQTKKKTNNFVTIPKKFFYRFLEETHPRQLASTSFVCANIMSFYTYNTNVKHDTEYALNKFTEHIFLCLITLSNDWTDIELGSLMVLGRINPKYAQNNEFKRSLDTICQTHADAISRYFQNNHVFEPRILYENFNGLVKEKKQNLVLHSMLVNHRHMIKDTHWVFKPLDPTAEDTLQTFVLGNVETCFKQTFSKCFETHLDLLRDIHQIMNLKAKPLMKIISTNQGPEWESILAKWNHVETLVKILGCLDSSAFFDMFLEQSASDEFPDIFPEYYIPHINLTVSDDKPICLQKITCNMEINQSNYRLRATLFNFHEKLKPLLNQEKQQDTIKQNIWLYFVFVNVIDSLITDIPIFDQDLKNTLEQKDSCLSYTVINNVKPNNISTKDFLHGFWTKQKNELKTDQEIYNFFFANTEDNMMRVLQAHQPDV